MLSITDLLDFIDLDRDTVLIVAEATGLPPEPAFILARELLASRRGILTLHHMFRDERARADERGHVLRVRDLDRAYRHFARKYPQPVVV